MASSTSSYRFRDTPARRRSSSIESSARSLRFANGSALVRWLSFIARTDSTARALLLQSCSASLRGIS